MSWCLHRPDTLKVIIRPQEDITLAGCRNGHVVCQIAIRLSVLNDFAKVGRGSGIL